MQEKESSNKLQRKRHLDAARTMAICFVVLNHAVQCVYTFRAEEWGYLSFGDKCIQTVLFCIGRLGVPLFLCITGALVLTKDFFNIEKVKKFYVHNCLYLCIITQIWIAVYFFFYNL